MQNNADRASTPFNMLEWLDCALFLDFDGTLVDLAATPDAVVVAPELVDALRILFARRDGRLAIISGRPIAQIDALLATLILPVAGVHGMERRDAGGRLHFAPIPSFSAGLARALQLAALDPRLLVEQKRGAMALHYRQAPELEQLCLAEMRAAIRECPGMQLLHGKMVIEVKPAGISKATAIRDFLAEPPYSGCRPLFAGDDTTDEVGFAYVQEAGGLGLKIGTGPSVARYRIAAPQALRMQLVQAAQFLSEGI